MTEKSIGLSAAVDHLACGCLTHLSRTGAGRMELDRVASEEQARWSGLSVKEKISDWASRHQYGIIFGSWALSIAVAGGIISRDR